MSQTTNQASTTPAAGASASNEVWVTTANAYEKGDGWIFFSGCALIIAAIMRAFDSIWAFYYKGAVPSNLQNALFGHSLSTYGWLWMGVAIVLFLAGLGVFVRSQVSRWLGVAAGALGAVTAIWWMPYYPVWSLTYIGICVLVVYGLAAHGQRQPAA